MLIRLTYPKKKEEEVNPSNHVYYKMGNGMRIQFWHDTWCNDSPLKEFFLALYYAVSNKEAFVVVMWSFQGH